MATAAELALALAVTGTGGVASALGSVGGKIGETERAAEHATGVFGGMGGALTKMAAVAATAFAGVKILEFAKNAVSAASDVNESLNKVQVVFGQSSGVIEQFASSAAKNLGLSRGAALDAAGQFGGLFAAMKIGAPQSAEMSKGILQLGADLASFNNIKPEEALEKLRAGLVGESEPLRSLGVNLSAAQVEARAAAMGFAKVNGEFTAGAKAQASYALILEQTKTAHGDFANTSTGMANAQRIISANFADITAQIGGALLPIIAPLISNFAQLLPGALAATTAAIARVQPMLALAAQAITALATGQGFDTLYAGLVKVFGPEIAGKIAAVVDPIAKFRAEVLPGIVAAVTPVVKAIGEDLKTAFDDLVKGVQELISHGSQLVKFFQDNQLAADALAAALAAGIIVKLGAMTIAMASSIPVLYEQATAWAVLNAAMIVAALPFIVIGAAIAAVILAGIEIYRNWQLITFVAQTMAEVIKIKVGEALNFLGERFAAIPGILQAAWGAVTAGVSAALSFLGERLAAIPGIFQAAWDAATAVVTAVVNGIYTFLTSTIPYWAGFIAGWLSGLPGIMGRLWNEAKDAIITAAQAAWVWVSTEVPTWPGRIAQFLANLGLLVLGKFNEAKDNIMSALTAAWNWVSANVPTWPGKIEQFLASVGLLVLAKFNEAKDAVIKALTDAWTWLSTEVPTWPGKIADFLRGLPGLITAALSGVFDAVTKPFKDAFEAVKGIVGGIIAKGAEGAAAGAAAADATARGAAAAAVGPQYSMQSMGGAGSSFADLAAAFSGAGGVGTAFWNSTDVYRSNLDAYNARLRTPGWVAMPNAPLQYGPGASAPQPIVVAATLNVDGRQLGGAGSSGIVRDAIDLAMTSGGD